MPPDPVLLKLLAEAVRINAAGLDDSADRLKVAAGDTTPIEGGEALRMIAGTLESHARSIRVLVGRLLSLATATEDSANVAR
jgi:hypothetical protein